MRIWQVVYTRIPTGHNRDQRAIVEAETAEDARELIKRALGEDRPGLLNYVIQPAIPYDPVKIVGRILHLDKAGI